MQPIRPNLARIAQRFSSLSFVLPLASTAVASATFFSRAHSSVLPRRRTRTATFANFTAATPGPTKVRLLETPWPTTPIGNSVVLKGCSSFLEPRNSEISVGTSSRALYAMRGKGQSTVRRSTRLASLSRRAASSSSSTDFGGKGKTEKQHLAAPRRRKSTSSAGKTAAKSKPSKASKSTVAGRKTRAKATTAKPIATSKRSTTRKRKTVTSDDASTPVRSPPKKNVRTRTPSSSAGTEANKNDDKCLPRTRELALQSQRTSSSTLCVVGVDEAGRGPLAGPVVAAAAFVPTNIPGVTDSKKMTDESKREELYDRIIKSTGVRWAAAIIDAGRIDEINILQATMEGMRIAVEALIDPAGGKKGAKREAEATAKKVGCYVVCGCDRKTTNEDGKSAAHYALVDGNRVPKSMPCDAEAMVKGDSREYAIGAASIIAKVTRDRIMREYDAMYPQYGLAKHKGYPTAAHMAAVHGHGASPIHRRTFAPLKHMDLDEEGRIVVEKDVK